jgi:cytochrome oxidase Cu insertion factor (SCO1/SenC/PrrC family)
MKTVVLLMVLLITSVVPVYAQRSSLPITVGSTLPNLTLLDEEGKEFSLASLRGSHAVIIFGCLT